MAKQVLALYKQFMVAAKSKPGFQDRIRQQFKDNAKIPLSESLRVEFLMRRARKQLDLLKNPRTISYETFLKGGPPSSLHFDGGRLSVESKDSHEFTDEAIKARY